nr:telomere repeat-binding factor 4-like [Tanacetum cinerariifolium]
DKWRNMSVRINGQGPREKARTPKPKASRMHVGMKRKRGAAANDKAYPQANVVRRVTRSGAAKHKASTQERKLDLKKDVSINRKPGATANNKASSQAK